MIISHIMILLLLWIKNKKQDFLTNKWKFVQFERAENTEENSDSKRNIEMI
jgi:hypothetical protein